MAERRGVRARAGPAAGGRGATIFADVKSAAEAFGHIATQAPQPMQAAASIASSASACGTGMALPSAALPVRTETKPPAAMMRSNAPRSTARSFTIGNAAARHGSSQSSSPSLKWRMWSWQTVVPRLRPVRLAVDHEAAHAADALAAVVIEGDGILALADEAPGSRRRASRGTTCAR